MKGVLHIAQKGSCVITSIRPKRPQALIVQESQLREWVGKRQVILTIYWKLSGLSLLDDERATQAELAEFAETLVDYLSQGHFSLYSKLIEDILYYYPTRQPNINYLYASLLSSTASLVDISDETAKMSLSTFRQYHDKVLGHFGHDWAHHLEMEDNLIKLWQEANDFIFQSSSLDEKEG